MGIENSEVPDQRTLIEKIEDARRTSAEVAASIKKGAEDRYGDMDEENERQFRLRSQHIKANARIKAVEDGDLEKARFIRELNIIPDSKIPIADNNEIPITRFIEKYLPEGTGLE